ncbi:MAG: hypothetical protein AAB530_03015 [Patescibacteria group bacterium]
MFECIRAKKKTENLNQINRINIVRASQGDQDISNSQWQGSGSRYKFGCRKSEISILGGVGFGVKGSAKNLGINSQATSFAGNSSKKISKISQTSFNKPCRVKPIIGF